MQPNPAGSSELKPLDLHSFRRRLDDVEFVVGGMAAVLQGPPVHTIDLDIVYALSESNIHQLELALTELAGGLPGVR